MPFRFFLPFTKEKLEKAIRKEGKRKRKEEEITDSEKKPGNGLVQFPKNTHKKD